MQTYMLKESELKPDQVKPMRKPNSKGAPTAKAFRDSAKTAKKPKRATKKRK